MLAGRRWRVVEVDARRKELAVVRGHGGNPPIFGGEPITPSEGVVMAKRRAYEGTEVPKFLDATAAQLLAEVREGFDRLGRKRCRGDIWRCVTGL